MAHLYGFLSLNYKPNRKGFRLVLTNNLDINHLKEFSFLFDIIYIYIYIFLGGRCFKVWERDVYFSMERVQRVYFPKTTKSHRKKLTQFRIIPWNFEKWKSKAGKFREVKIKRGKIEKDVYLWNPYSWYQVLGFILQRIRKH